MRHQLHFSALIVLASCFIDSEAWYSWKRKKENVPTADKTILKAAWRINSVGMDINSALTEQKVYGEMSDNIIYSAFSIYSALASTYCASKRRIKNSRRKDPFARALHMKPNLIQRHFKLFGKLLGKVISSSVKAKFVSADAFWLSDKCEFRKAFLDTVHKKYFKSHPLFVTRKLPFSSSSSTAVQEINGWTKNITNHMIEEIVSTDTVNADTKAVITNAMYFKGAWESPFDESSTHEEEFVQEYGNKVMVSMMQQTTRVPYVGYSSDFQINFEVIEMFYKGKEFSLLVFLPRKGVELDSLFGEGKYLINAKFIETLREHMDTTTLQIGLPKFKAESEYKAADLGSVTKALRQGVALNGAVKNVPGQCDGTARLDDIFTKTIIVVDEKGSEASAATAVVMGRSLPQSFIVNRPFAFAIHHVKTKTILFFGKIYHPKF